MKEQWEFEDDCDPAGGIITCHVIGSGPYRFNQYGNKGICRRFIWKLMN